MGEQIKELVTKLDDPSLKPKTQHGGRREPAPAG